jgi:hypothetical protein
MYHPLAARRERAAEPVILYQRGALIPYQGSSGAHPIGKERPCAPYEGAQGAARGFLL